MEKLDCGVEEREELLTEIVKVLKKHNRLLQTQEIQCLEEVVKTYDNDFLNKTVLMKKVLQETEKEIEQKLFNERKDDTDEEEKMRKINVFQRLPKNVLDSIKDIDAFLMGEMSEHTAKLLERYYLNATVYDGRCFVRFLYW